jgi:NAD(P)-dependent dehydrogenase (short-subunit alcohol dehydrogenase family)
LDNAEFLIKVNSVCPSWVETPMVKEAVEGNPALKAFIEKCVPMGRIAQADEIADVVMFLSSPRSSYVTGSGWIVDGGTTLTVHT